MPWSLPNIVRRIGLSPSSTLVSNFDQDTRSCWSMSRCARCGDSSQTKQFSSQVPEASAIHLARQPLATVDPDLHGEREPALNASVEEPEDGMDLVAVEE